MKRGSWTLVVMVGCGEVEPVHWDPLDVAAIEQQLDAPTALLTEAALDELLASPVGDLSIVEALLALGRFPIEQLEGTMPEQPRGLDLDGTQLYVRVACPGPTEVAPDPEFRYGSISLYSERLAAEVLDELTVRGDVYGLVRDCTVGALEVDGAMRVNYDDVADRLAIGFDATVDGRDFDAVVVDDQRVRVLYTDATGGTLTIEQGSPPAFTIRGRDRQVECDQTREPTCGAR
jgi:hypothetical protein